MGLVGGTESRPCVLSVAAGYCLSLAICAPATQASEIFQRTPTTPRSIAKVGRTESPPVRIKQVSRVADEPLDFAELAPSPDAVAALSNFLASPSSDEGEDEDEDLDLDNSELPQLEFKSMSERVGGWFAERNFAPSIYNFVSEPTQRVWWKV
jgi:hypothetical protein